MPLPLAVLGQELDTVVRTLWGECRGEQRAGQIGVAWVIRNRVGWPGAPHWWGGNAIAVCLRKGQFSCWNADDPNREGLQRLAGDDPEYVALYDVARAVMAGEIDDPTGYASHYEVIGTDAVWAVGHTPSAVIGNHAFYSIGPGA